MFERLLAYIKINNIKIRIKFSDIFSENEILFSVSKNKIKYFYPF